MTWRMYARRHTTGEWLHTNVPMTLEPTWQLNGTGHAVGFIPDALDVDQAADGLPMWVERGTTLYVEEGQRLVWSGLCSWQRRTRNGREVEFKGRSSAFDLIGFDGRIREWEPDPFDMVARLLSNAQAQPNGDLGFNLERHGSTGAYPGDEQWPEPRPERVKRRRGETREHFLERREARLTEQARWDRLYGERRPYEVAWWEAPYVLDEIRQLAREIPFDWWEDHRWTNRDNLAARHDFHVDARRGTVRADVSLVEGVNIAEVLAPSTDVDRYANHIVMLGAGEGRKMRRAEVGSRDGRVRTTRYGEAKRVHNEKRLRARARARFARADVAVKLDQAVMRGELGGLDLGDEVRVESRLFSGWCRVYGITRNTRTGNVTLTFNESGGDG